MVWPVSTTGWRSPRERTLAPTSTYFPFAPHKGQALRPFQGYMLKFPRDLVRLLGLPTPPATSEISAGQRPSRDASPGAAYWRAPSVDRETAADSNSSSPSNTRPRMITLRRAYRSLVGLTPKITRDDSIHRTKVRRFAGPTEDQ